MQFDLLVRNGKYILYLAPLGVVSLPNSLRNLRRSTLPSSVRAS